MKSEESVIHLSANSTVSAALVPHALYESNGTIFELYVGGRPYQPFVMRWEQLKTATVIREGDYSVEVRIHQRRRAPSD